MEIGMVFEDVESGGNFVIGATKDYWVLDDNPEDLGPRPKCIGYDGCRFLGMWEEIYGLA